MLGHALVVGALLGGSLGTTDVPKAGLSPTDPKADPCNNFYQYACGPWLAANPIPADQRSWGHGAALSLQNETTLKKVLETAAAAGANRSPVEQRIGDYYASCTDEASLEALGAKPLQGDLDRIAAMKSKADLALVVAHLHEDTVGLIDASDSGSFTPLFGFLSSQDFDDASRVVASLDQGGLALPDRDYYLKDDAHSAELRKGYLAHVAHMLTLLGESAAAAAADAQTVLDIETALAKSSLDLVTRRDPSKLNHKLSFDQLQALSPSFNWKTYLGEVASPATEHYLVIAPDFFKGLETELQVVSLDAWKVYLRWHLVHSTARLLSKPFVEEDFAFFGKTLTGQKEDRPRWRRCVQRVDSDLGEALGQAFVAQVFPPAAKERMVNLVHALEVSLGDEIRELDWMSAVTRKAADGKLKAIEDKIGYPDHWRDYSALTIARGDLVGDAFRSNAFELRRQLAKIGKPVDRSEWTMTPPTVNAYYDPQLNTINFPAGILQPPFFDLTADDAVNFGGIGAIIGHEMTHGFDDQGRQFDAHGNLKDWWTGADAIAFKMRAQCVSDEYSGFEAGDLHVNGDLTLGENTADNGGVRVALRAFESILAKQGKPPALIDGMTPEQRFFVAYGQVWCSHMRPETLRLLVTSNPHAPPQCRVNGVLQNMPEFQKAFQCRAGQQMVSPRPCRVW